MREGEQLDLFVSKGVVLARVPWAGQSPRVLTASYRQFILKAQAVKSVSDFVDPGQYDLWLPKKKAPRVNRGAPSLLPLPRRTDHG